MNIRFVLTLLVFCLNFSLFSQNNEGYIKYTAYSGKSSVAPPPNENGYPYEYIIQEGTLYFNPKSSVYQQLQNKYVTRVQTDSDGNYEKTEVPRDNWDPIGWVYLKDKSNNYILSRVTYFNRSSYVNVKEDLEKISWNITNEKKNIGDYNCTKATATYKGRNWVVWFTPKIPFQVGPWKLYGLPGAILEAYSENLDFMFKLKELKIPAEIPSEKFEFPVEEENMLSLEEYLKTNQQKKDKYLKYMETVARENDGSVNIKFYPEIEK
ncbi:MAG: GLPGLI family protein [Flavobacteriaceae bacterium]|nr:GLPGLI family protein [Flavobacteriaceae bacterium]